MDMRNIEPFHSPKGFFGLYIKKKFFAKNSYHVICVFDAKTLLEALFLRVCLAEKTLT